MEELFRTVLLWLSRNVWLRRTVTRIPIAYRIAGRFIAGETVGDAMAAVRARDDYLDLLDEIRAQGVESDVSLPLPIFRVQIAIQGVLRGGVERQNPVNDRLAPVY
jgi:hypothetical protein